MPSSRLFGTFWPLGFMILLTFALPFGPWTDKNLLHSDSAIPVIMSNENTWTLFHLYYFGQDRFGAWPYTILSMLHGFFQFSVTAEVLFVIQLCFFSTSIIPLMGILDDRRGLWTSLFFAMLFFYDLLPWILFDLSQPYIWQITCFLWGWSCWKKGIRLMQHNPKMPGTVLRLGCATMWLSLAMWSSPLTMLLFLGPVFVDLVLPAFKIRSFKISWAKIVVFVLPGLFEFSIRAVYYGFVSKHFINSNFFTPTSLILKKIPAGLSHLLPHLVCSWFSRFLIFVITIALIQFLISHGSMKRHDATIVLSSLISVIMLLFALASSRWIAANAYHLRYLIQVQIFILISASLCFRYSLEIIFNSQIMKIREYKKNLRLCYIGMCSLAIIFAFVWERPIWQVSHRYADMKEAVRQIAEHFPTVPVTGSYWGTYVFAAFPDIASIITLPVDGQSQRTPQWRPIVSTAHQLLFSHYSFGDSGSAYSPVRRLEQFGKLWRLEKPNVLSVGEYTFSLYVQSTLSNDQ